MTTEVASLKAVFTADTANLIKGTNEARNALVGATESMGGRLQNLGGQITNLGKNWTLATAPIAAALGISVKKFASFETAMANANSITGATGAAAERLNDQILAIGESSRQGPQAAAEAYYQIVSGVADASTHMAILNTSLAVSEAGAAELSGTVGALVGSMNAYGASADDAGRFGDIMTQTVQQGVLTMDQLAAALPNVTSQASSMGIGFDEINAALARMTQVGNSASTSSTQIRQAMVALNAPTTNMKALFEELGVSTGQALVDQYGFIGALEILNTEASEAGMTLNAVWGSTEATNAAMVLGTQQTLAYANSFSKAVEQVGNLGSKQLSLDLMGDMPDDAGAFAIVDAFEGVTDAAQAIQADTFQADIDNLTSSLDGLAIKVGEILVPALTDAIDTISPIVDKISLWATENPKVASAIVMMAGAAVIAGPALMALGTVISTVGTVVGLLGAGIALLLSPIYLVIAAGVLLGTGLYLLATNFDTVKEAVTGLIDDGLNKLKGVGENIIEGIAGVPAAVERMVAGALNPIIEMINTVIDAMNKIPGMDIGTIGLLDDGSSGTGGGTGGLLKRLDKQHNEEAQPSSYGNSLPRRAAGGPVMGGGAYMVGERGPEMFMPASSGTIIPNHALASGGGGNTIVLQNPVFNGVTDIQSFFDELEREAGRRS